VQATNIGAISWFQYKVLARVFHPAREPHRGRFRGGVHLVSRPLTDEQLLELDGRNRELSGSPDT